MEASGAKRIDLRSVIRDKNPALGRMIPGFIIKWLQKVVHEDELNQFFESYGTLKNVELVKAGLTYLGIDYQVHLLNNLPTSGRNIFVSNHPLGGLDGLVFISELSKYFENIKFPVNDILMNVGNMSDIFLPINKHGSQARDAVTLIDQAYASDAQILYFPAGLCSRKIKGEIRDLTWQKNFVSKAIKHERDVVPLYFSGKNSNFFYNLANIRKRIGLRANIEMLYLPDEMFRQKNEELHLVIGKPIPWETFDKSKTVAEWAEWIKEKSYELAYSVVQTK